MQTAFDASSVKIVDVKKQPEYLDAVVAQLHAKYPEFANADDEDTYEDLSYYTGRNDFVLALVGAEDRVAGFVAGAIASKSKTAGITYMGTSEDTPEIQKALIGATNDYLSARKVQASFVEFYAEGSEVNVARDKADKALYGAQGVVRVPINYRQPVGEAPGDGGRIEGMQLWVNFTDKNLDSAKKTDIVLAHLEAFAKVYDPKLKIADNRDDLAGYAKILTGHDWSKPPVPAPTFEQR